MDQIQKTLTDLIEIIKRDSQLDDEGKADLIDLISEVVADPTPNNIEALALTLEELGKSQEYMVAKEMLSNYEAENATNSDVPVATESPASESSTPQTV